MFDKVSKIPEGMIEAIVKIKMPETCAVAAVKASAQVKLLDATPFSKEGVKSLLQIESSCLQEVVENIKKENLEDANRVSESKLKASVAVSRCIPARSILEAGCFIKYARHTEEGVEWHIIARRSSLIKLAKILEEKNYSFEIIRIGGLEDESDILTDKEREILEYALAIGYFDSPKRAGIRKIAGHFGISISTASETIRRGIRKILMKHLED